ncbi:MAG: flippase-like domain-containing protein [Verrucomicrobia bacterium]|nr:flippase-like domain-containing protein [Verrucomicrobiota bacterium]
MSRLIKVVSLVFGLGLVIWLFWQADPGRVWEVVKSLGAWAPLLLLPYGLVYLVDTAGWRFAFGRDWPRQLSFGRLLRIRWAGEAVNNLVPSGYLGGEAVKVYLLRKAGVSGWTGATSVVVSKTVQILAQVMFIGLGAFLGGMHLPVGSPVRQAMWMVAGLAAVVLLVLVGVQYYGFLKTVGRLARLSRRVRAWFERHRERVREVDDEIRGFYHRQPGWLALSVGAYFAGWVCDSIEIWLVSAILGWPLDWTQAMAIEAFVGVAKALGTFVPASMGVQESGVVLLFRAFGLGSTEALAYALIRRARELVYALVGLGFLWRQEASFRQLKARVSSETAR